MKEDVLERLLCPSGCGPLRWRCFAARPDGAVGDGVVWCPACGGWHPIEDGLLELLPPGLAYADDRARFWQTHAAELARLEVDPPAPADAAGVEAQRKQQQHFDWYAGNDRQTYLAYEGMPFWRNVDATLFADWRRRLRPGGWFLDVGCAQGRSTFPFLDLPLRVVAFDVSKALIRQAIAKYRAGTYRADATFFVGDGTSLPLADATFDHVLVYGVLHHLPDPARACREIARVLKPGGSYFGLENNTTVFRALFDLLMRLVPVWHEEAGAQPLMSAEQIRRWFAGTPVRLRFDTRVFVPPHLVNLFGQRLGGGLLRASDAVGRSLPFLRDNGGLIAIRGEREPARPA